MLAGVGFHWVEMLSVLSPNASNDCWLFSRLDGAIDTDLSERPRVRRIG
ncbi:MAG TPA: hypothetical protein V6D34_12510 [Candidatus Sericytochromatia bacterium]